MPCRTESSVTHRHARHYNRQSETYRNRRFTLLLLLLFGLIAVHAKQCPSTQHIVPTVKTEEFEGRTRTRTILHPSIHNVLFYDIFLRLHTFSPRVFCKPCTFSPRLFRKPRTFSPRVFCQSHTFLVRLSGAKVQKKSIMQEKSQKSFRKMQFVAKMGIFRKMKSLKYPSNCW